MSDSNFARRLAERELAREDQVAADLAEIHQAIREAHGAGRAEFLFDRERALGHDLREGIGQLVLNPEYFPRAKRHEGTVVTRGSCRYRVIVAPEMVGMHDQHGQIRQGYWVAPLSAIPPLVPEPTVRRDDEVEHRIRFDWPVRYPKA